MKCKDCGGLVTWRGPFSGLTHTKCESCGGVNCKEVEDDSPVTTTASWPYDDMGTPVEVGHG